MSDDTEDVVPEMPDDYVELAAWTDDPLHKNIDDMDDDEIEADDVEVGDEDEDDDDEDDDA